MFGVGQWLRRLNEMKFPIFRSVTRLREHMKAIGMKISNKDLLSDGCSQSPDFQFKECCKLHDFWYTTGLLERKEADIRLRDCIREKSNWFLSQSYYRMVRLFGKNRWDYYRKFELERDYEWSQLSVEMEIMSKIPNRDHAFDLIDQLRKRYQEKENRRIDPPQDTADDS